MKTYLYMSAKCACTCKNHLTHFTNVPLIFRLFVRFLMNLKTDLSTSEVLLIKIVPVNQILE